MTRKNIIVRTLSSNNKIVSSRFFEQSQFEQMIMSLSKLYKIRIKLRFLMGMGVSSYRTIMFTSIIICYVILFCNTLFSIEVEKITYASLRYLAANFFLYFHPSLTTFWRRLFQIFSDNVSIFVPCRVKDLPTRFAPVPSTLMRVSLLLRWLIDFKRPVVDLSSIW